MRSEAYGIFRTLKRSLVRSSRKSCVGRLQQNRALEACGACAFRDDYVEAIRALHMACEREGRRLIILISPVHPALRDMYTGLFLC